jgi:type I restriction enzyme S subunit
VIALFHRRIEPLLSYRLVLNDKNINLRTTRDLLLPKIISGEILVEAAAELTEQTV